MKRTCPHRILLVYPEIPDNTFYSYHEALAIVGRKCMFPPLGLLTVAAMIPDTASLRLIDMNVRELSDEDLDWADAVFLSAMIVQDESLREVIDRCRCRQIPIVAGGPHPTSQSRDIPGIDHTVAGEVENTFHQFWDDFTHGRAKAFYANATNGNRSAIGPDLSQTPIPRFDLIDKRDYSQMAIQISRGCPIGCEFCDVWRRFGRKIRYKPVENVIAELDNLYQRVGWRGSVFIVDDNLVGNAGKARSVLAAMAEWQRKHGYPFSFYTQAGLALADDEELLNLFRRAGIIMVFVGIESPSEASLKEAKKTVNLARDVKKRIRRIQENGIEVFSGFIIGFDGDPQDIADSLISCIEELGIPVALVSPLIALPETDLHERLEREGRIERLAPDSSPGDCWINFKTKRSKQAIIGDYKRILSTIYSQDMSAYVRRCRTLRRRIGRNCLPFRINKRELAVLARYVVKLISLPYRWQVVRLLLETLIEKPYFFAAAVSLSILGHHFRAVAKRNEYSWSRFITL